MMFYIFYIILIHCQSIANANKPVTVHTNYGDVEGYETDLARVFYGIPYAQPPVDTLRWKRPVPIPKWAPRVINATQPAPACPQPPCSLPAILCPKIMSEDCLYLNVFTPLSNDSSLLPVMLYIAGGNFQYLDASIPVYEPQHFVNQTNVICVLIQYRLGVLGFYATGPGPNDLNGNYGILDQRTAIAWVKANIKAFGGNPNQITMYGESAGAQSTALHYITPEMQSFFQAAIIQSAPMSIPFRTYAEYITSGVLLGEQLNCSYTNISCFRAASYQQIIAAQKVVNTMLTSLEILLFFEPWVPVIDNSVVHGQVIDIIQNVSFPLKPLIIGTLTEEAVLYIYEGWHKPVYPEQYAEILVATFNRHALKVLERFPPQGTGDQRLLLASLGTRWVFACSTRVFARKAATYTYVFGYPLDFDGWDNLTFCIGHVCHGSELPYVFESGWVNFTDAGRKLATNLVTYWTNFGKTHDPNQPVTPSLSWPKTSIGSEQYMYFQNPLQVEENYLKDDCDFFDKIGYKYYYP
ncbi:unnamed protein product [Rotaria sordida]|uniref:Carboxylesterase type B domain-containing protein n=1 Tax=Rotaria sordida TaxID=392033 RepID=A0A814F0I5_9BILA|nr:unnamed protein product [Rotaria sordida]